MNIKKNKYVSFRFYRSQDKLEREVSSNVDDEANLTKRTLEMRSAMEDIRNGRLWGTRGVYDLQSPNFQGTKKSIGSKTQVFDPQGGSFIQRWNKMFVLSCVIAVSLDPLFFYIPVIDRSKNCLDLDQKMMISACVLRSLTDLFYILHIIFQFRTGYIAPSSRVFGRGELIEDPHAIAKRYLSSYFIIDVLSVLPLPQVELIILTSGLRGLPVSLITKDILEYTLFIQYIPRFIRIIPLYKDVTRNSGILTETAWAGAALNLFIYMLASHVVGALWYLLTIEMEDSCWRIVCEKDELCEFDNLYCGQHHKGNYTFLTTSCPHREPKNSTDFNFGIYLDALSTDIVETRYFSRKFFYCFWWGLRNLSSLGQNLKTSTFIGEILFAIFISILGLILFTLLIGNMQKYLQSMSVRLEERRVKMRDSEQWMSHRMLPDSLKERIRRYEQYRWLETRGVEEESLVRNLPKDLRRDIKRHLCWDLLKRVPLIEKMDEQLLDALCDRLKPVLYTERSIIVRDGDPVEEMLFVMRGNILVRTTDGGRTGSFNTSNLKPGDFCGEELLTWALDPKSSSTLPISARTMEAVTDVEAFALMADDFKFVASQFRLLHSKELQHTFRFYSQHWKTWATRIIQAAWRRHCRRKHEKALWEEEERLQNALAKQAGASPSLGATIYASKFAANVIRGLQQNRGQKATIVPQQLSSLLLQKPAEPDFSAKDRI